MRAPSVLRQARWFLHYAYAPNPNWNALKPFMGVEFSDRKEWAATAGGEALHDVASAVALKAFEDTFSTIQGDFVIPLGGGRDSRFVLAMAIELGLKDRLAAFTFGTPGGLDGEIAKKVAAHFGVRHHRLDILKQRVTWADLEQAYVNGAQWTDLVLAHLGQSWRQFASHAVSGYLGDAAGSHYEEGSECFSLPQAKAAFNRVNLKFPPQTGEIDLIGEVGEHLLPPALLNYPEQLDLVYRQEGYIRRLVAAPHANVRTPLAHPDWLRLMYALPGRLRVGSKFYVEFLQRRFPRAFALPTTNRYRYIVSEEARKLSVRIVRRWIRIVEAGYNAVGLYGRNSVWKYGDPRHLCTAIDLSDSPFAQSLIRLERTRAWRKTKTEASEWRLRAMLRSNLLLDKAERKRHRSDAAGVAASRCATAAEAGRA